MTRVYSRSSRDIIQGLEKIKENKLIPYQTIDEKKIYRKVKNKLMLKKCEYCGYGFNAKSNHQLYCCKKCARYAKMDRDCKWRRDFRLQYSNRVDRLGTIDFGPHAEKNLNKEMSKIKMEKIKTFRHK